MRTWIRNFKPGMITFVHPCPEDETAIVVQAVCADRVFRVRYSMAIKEAGNDEAILKFIGTTDNFVRRMARRIIK
jgi:hypothetical protein